PRAAAESSTREVDDETAALIENEADHRLGLVLLLATDARAHELPSRPRSGGWQACAGGLDIFRLAVDEFTGGGLDGPRLAVRVSPLHRQPIGVLADHVVEPPVAAFFEQLLSSAAVSWNQTQNVPIGRRFRARLGQIDAFAAQPLHRLG